MYFVFNYVCVCVCMCGYFIKDNVSHSLYGILFEMYCSIVYCTVLFCFVLFCLFVYHHVLGYRFVSQCKVTGIISSQHWKRQKPKCLKPLQTRILVAVVIVFPVMEFHYGIYCWLVVVFVLFGFIISKSFLAQHRLAFNNHMTYKHTHTHICTSILGFICICIVCVCSNLNLLLLPPLLRLFDFIFLFVPVFVLKILYRCIHLYWCRVVACLVLLFYCIFIFLYCCCCRFCFVL